MDSILRYKAFGITSGTYEYEKLVLAASKAEGEERLTLLVRDDKAVASW